VTVDLSAVDAANAALQKDPHAAASTKAYGAATTSALHELAQPVIPTPPAAASSTVGLVQYSGSLSSMTHLGDGTYSTLVGDWTDASRLGQLPELGFAYTDAQTGWQSPNPAFKVDLADPATFVAQVSAQLSAYGCRGVFLDNVISTNSAALLPFLKFAGAALIAKGYLVLGNCQCYVSGKTEAFDGKAWSAWVAQLKGCLTHAMMEYSQQWAGGPSKYQVLTGSNWAECQLAVAGAHAAGMRFVGMTYGPLQTLVYGRASMIEAGAQAGDVFVGHTIAETADPYDPGWTMADPQNVSVNSSAGSATL